MGDELKVDQIKFFYFTTKILFDSAVKEKLINRDKVVLETVIPNMIVFKAILVIRDIMITKMKEEKEEKEKEHEKKKVKFEEEVKESIEV